MGLKIITIDGPAGSGKSSVARSLARVLDFNLLNSGLLYRAITYVVDLKLRCNSISLEQLSAEMFVNFCSELVISFVDRAGDPFIKNGVDIISADMLESLSVRSMVAQVSSLSFVREYVLQLQKRVALQGNLVAEGRDCGTDVFPHATVKIYLDASLETRAQRMLQRLSANHNDLTKIQAALIERDNLDMSRTLAPLRVAPDAIVFNSSNYYLDEVLKKIMCLIAPKLKLKK